MKLFSTGKLKAFTHHASNSVENWYFKIVLNGRAQQKKSKIKELLVKIFIKHSQHQIESTIKSVIKKMNSKNREKKKKGTKKTIIKMHVPTIIWFSIMIIVVCYNIKLIFFIISFIKWILSNSFHHQKHYSDKHLTHHTHIYYVTVLCLSYTLIGFNENKLLNFNIIKKIYKKHTQKDGFCSAIGNIFSIQYFGFWLFSVHNKIKDCREHKYVYEYKSMFKYYKKENWCVYVLMWRRWKLWIWKICGVHTQVKSLFHQQLNFVYSKINLNNSKSRQKS